jgi:hypothetical protein
LKGIEIQSQEQYSNGIAENLCGSSVVRTSQLRTPNPGVFFGQIANEAILELKETEILESRVLRFGIPWRSLLFNPLMAGKKWRR